MKPLLTILCLLILSATGRTQITFQRSYDLGDSEAAFIIVQTFDSGYAVCGMKGTGINQRVYLLRTDKNGDTLWSKNYIGYVYGMGRNMRVTHDSGFIICSNENGMIHLIRTDKNGDTLWTRRPAPGPAMSIAVSPDHGFAIITSAETMGLVKTDSVGTLEWQRSYLTSPLPYDGDPVSLEVTSDGGYIITGLCDYNNYAMNRLSAFLLKTDSNGDSTWLKKYSRENRMIHGYSVSQSEAHGYVIAGQIYYGYPGFVNRAYLIRTDESGDTLWTRKSNYLDTFYASCDISANQEIICSGTTDNPYPGGGLAMFLEKVDLQGELKFSRAFPSGDCGNSVVATSDHGFIMAGEKEGDIVLVKTDAAGHADPFAVPELPGSPTLSVFPNPSNGIFSVSVAADDQILEVLDCHGTCLLRRDYPGKAQETTRIDLSSFPKGIYLIRVTASDEILTAKVILQ
jgi:hypothetical protein